MITSWNLGLLPWFSGKSSDEYSIIQKVVVKYVELQPHIDHWWSSLMIIGFSPQRNPLILLNHHRRPMSVSSNVGHCWSPSLRRSKKCLKQLVLKRSLQTWWAWLTCIQLETLAFEFQAVEPLGISGTCQSKCGNNGSENLSESSTGIMVNQWISDQQSHLGMFGGIPHVSQHETWQRHKVWLNSWYISRHLKTSSSSTWVQQLTLEL